MNNSYKLKVLRESDIKREKFTLDQDVIGLQPNMYRNLFGKQFNSDHDSKPWLRGIVRVERTVPHGRIRSIRLRFRGTTGIGVDQTVCILPRNARQQLGITRADDQVELFAEWQPWSRFWFYWNHPLDANRVAFKLGVVALIVSVISVAISLR